MNRTLPGGVVVAHGTLDPMTQVRILAGQPAVNRITMGLMGFPGTLLFGVIPILCQFGPLPGSAPARSLSKVSAAAWLEA